LRIIYFSLDYSPHDYRFLAALAETEHEVYYVRLQRGLRPVEDRPIPAKINQVLWAGGQNEFHWRDLLRLTFDFQRLTREIKPDLIHAGPIQTCGLIATLSGWSGPLLAMSWGFDLMQDSERNGWWRWATKYVLRRADAFVSDCESTRVKAIDYGMNADHTVVFPWGVDLDHFAPLSVVSHPLSGFTLFCNRSWEPRYGVDVLARAFVKVAGSRSDVGLLLVGGGSQAQAIRQILERGGVLGLVTFAGHISNRDLPRYYHMADLYISPSYVDGSSVSLMEALACGMPCLVSDIPANKEWVTDGVDGWLFPDGNVDALAAKILQVLDNRDAMQEMRHAARAVAEARADWKKNFPKLFEAYRLAIPHRKETA
jgi:L-malate glycosyltransferase